MFVYVSYQNSNFELRMLTLMPINGLADALANERLLRLLKRAGHSILSARPITANLLCILDSISKFLRVAIYYMKI